MNKSASFARVAAGTASAGVAACSLHLQIANQLRQVYPNLSYTECGVMIARLINAGVSPAVLLRSTDGVTL